MINKVFCCLLLFSSALYGQENLRLLDYYQYYQDDANALYKEMVREAEAREQDRQEQVAGLSTAEDWQAYRTTVQQKLKQLLGPFPERTPLNPQITGVLERETYRVEKVIYESQPGFYVTASLFLPRGREKKLPAIVYCSGHSPLGFRSDVYQTMIINLVKKGFIVLAFDPLGQGERMQYPEDGGDQSRVGGPTHEHSYVGAQCFITGNSLANHMIWDGIRSVDYLLSRPEVDPQRIGLTGRSGGGTQTTYLAAFDDRIYAAAPEAYLTRLDILLKTKGPQDAEQNIPYFIDQQLDLADFLIARAPQPTLIISTTRDMFSIAGARETYQEVKRAYEAWGKPENIEMSEDNAPHASTPKNREAMYAFFQHHLQQPGDAREQAVELFKPEELWATPHGQVATDQSSKNVFDLNQEESRQKKERIRQRRADYQPQPIVDQARRWSGFGEAGDVGEVQFAGEYAREGYAVQKYLMVGKDHVSPFLLFVPEQKMSDEAVVYFHPAGKAAEAGPGGAIEALVRQGVTVLAADLPGTGELGPGYLTGDAYIDSISYNQWFGGILLNRSIVARQAADMLRMAKYLSRMLDDDNLTVTAVAYRTLTPALLHAAAFDSVIDRTVLVEPLISYESLLTHEMYDARWIYSTVAGAMNAYDLADLAATLAPRPLMVVNPVDHQFNPVSASAFQDEWAVADQQYQSSERLRVVFSEEATLSEQVIDWMK